MKKLIAIFLIPLAFLAIRQAKALQSSKQEKYPLITAFNQQKEQINTANLRTINQSIQLTGKIQASNFAKLSFQTSGQLVWLGVKVGDRVKKGQAIASLDRSQLQKQFQKQMNNYLTTRWSFEDVQDKYKPIKEKSLIDDEIKRILDRTQFGLNNSVLDVEIANLAIKYSTIISPIDGLVVDLPQPQAGLTVVASQPIATIVDPQSLYFRSEIDEQDVVKITAGQSSQVTLDSFKDSPIQTNIGYIAFDSLDNKASTVYEVRFPLNLSNQDLKYRLGMNGTANIITSSDLNVISVPSNTIYEDQNNKFVYKLSPQGDKKIRVSIQTGVSDDNFTQVVQGIAVGDKIVQEKYDQSQ